MSKDAHDMTEEALNALEKKISGVYEDAAKDVEKTVNDYFAQFEKRDAEQLKLVESGELSKNEYNQWRLTQMGRGERYKDLQNKLSERYTEANEVAHAYVYDATPSIYSLNRNYSSYAIEQAGANVNFNAWDEATVRRLIVDNPNLMPNYPEERAFARGIDLAYGKERITACVTGGILQGNSPYQIADDLQRSLENMNRASAIRTARTAFTAAENAGNQDAYEEARDMGIPMQKEWMATDDDRTREDHLEADGQVVDIDDPFIVGGEELMYPGDPSGEPEQIYNCRCRMISRVAGVDMSDVDRWADESFEDWEAEKGIEAESPEEMIEQATEVEYNPETLSEQLERLTSNADKLDAIEELTGFDEEKSAEVLRALCGGEGTSGWFYGAYENIATLRDEDCTAMANAINDYITAAPKYEGTIYRGLGMYQSDIDQMLESGTFKELGALSSWSSSSAVAKDFSTGCDEDMVQVMLQTSDPSMGTPVAHLSMVYPEQEVLVSNMENDSYIISQANYSEQEDILYINLIRSR